MSNKQRQKKGTALAYMLVIMTTVIILLTAIVKFVVSHVNYSLHVSSKEESFQIAESGINFYRWYLAHNVELKSPEQVNDFWENGNPLGVENPYVVDYKDPSGSIIGQYKLEVTRPPAWSTIVDVTATGWTLKHPESQRKIRVVFRRPVMSDYMIFAEGMFRLSSGTVIWGKMHSNTGIHFDGVANNVVTAGKQTYYDEDYKANRDGVWTEWPNEYNSDMGSKVFLFNKKFPVDTFKFDNMVTDFSNMLDAAQAPDHSNLNNCTTTGCHFGTAGKGRSIKLYKGTDGKMKFDICTVNSYNKYVKKYDWLGRETCGTGSNNITNYLKNSGSGTCTSCSGECLTTYDVPNNGVIFVENNVWIEGIINGIKTTVVAYDGNAATDNTKSIFLKNNLTYTNYDGTDIIGLCAQNNVEIIKESANNLQIDGALLAKEGTVGRERYCNDKHQIAINGSIATKGRITFGLTDGSGYEHRTLNFDSNLVKYTPPYFPTKQKYIIDSWEEL
jgi:hypothetical protein